MNVWGLKEKCSVRTYLNERYITIGTVTEEVEGSRKLRFELLEYLS